MEGLIKSIEGMIVEKSLSLEVLTIVTKIRDEHAELAKIVADQVETIKEKDKTINGNIFHLNELKVKIEQAINDSL